jgi:hypothetical protein
VRSEFFLFQFSVPSLFLKVIQWLLVSSSSSSRHFCPPPYFPSIKCFRRHFLRKMWLISLFIICWIFLFSLTLGNTYSFLTRSVQLIYVHLQRHISRLYSYFWRCSFRSAQVSEPHAVVCIFKSNVIVNRTFHEIISRLTSPNTV